MLKSRNKKNNQKEKTVMIYESSHRNLEKIKKEIGLTYKEIIDELVLNELESWNKRKKLSK